MVYLLFVFDSLLRVDYKSKCSWSHFQVIRLLGNKKRQTSLSKGLWFSLSFSVPRWLPNISSNVYGGVGSGTEESERPIQSVLSLWLPDLTHPRISDFMTRNREVSSLRPCYRLSLSFVQWVGSTFVYFLVTCNSGKKIIWLSWVLSWKHFSSFSWERHWFVLCNFLYDGCRNRSLFVVYWSSLR